MLTERSFYTGAITLHYAEGPPSGKPWVLLHGATGWWPTFLPILPSLLVRHHTYALDLRGHGRSGRAPDTYLISHYAEDVLAFLRDQLTEPTALLGHSLGAIVSILVAAKEPDLVRALVLEDPPLTTLANQPDEVLISRFADEIFPALHQVMTMDGTREEKLSAVAAILPEADAAQVRHRLAELSHCDAAVLAPMIERRLFEHYCLEALLPKIACPVLLIQADPDVGGVLNDGDAELATSLLADCTHVYLQGVGHGIHVEQPVAFTRIVSDFLESL